MTDKLRRFEGWPGGAPAAATVTFDGGYDVTVQHAVPLLEQFGVPSTWFLVAGAVGGHLEGRPVADWVRWRLLADSGMVEIGNHTLTHPLLRPGLRQVLRTTYEYRRRPRTIPASIRAQYQSVGLRASEYDLTNTPAGLRQIIDDALTGQRVLSWHLDRPIRSFAYPNGRSHPRLARALQASGHVVLRTTIERINYPESLNLSSIGAVVWTQTLDDRQADAWLEDTVKKGGWLVDVHHVVSDDSDYLWTTSVSRLRNHLARLVSSGVWLATTAEVSDYLQAHPAHRPNLLVRTPRE